MAKDTKHLRVLDKVGKNPEQDWFFLLTGFTLLIIATLVFLGFNFFNVLNFIKTGLNAPDSQSGQNVKTKEEELRDTITAYQEKKKVHESLLGRSKNEIDKAPATTTVATTTASSTQVVQPKPAATSSGETYTLEI